MSAICSSSWLAGDGDLADRPSQRGWLSTASLRSNALCISLYGDPAGNIDDLKASIQAQGILVPLVVTRGDDPDTWEILSGHRRWACAQALNIRSILCEIWPCVSEGQRRHLVLEYNRQRRKTFSQLMREADLLEELLGEEARRRKIANLAHRRGLKPCREDDYLGIHECRNSDDRTECEPGQVNPHKESRRGRTDVAVADRLGLGGKDLYRQARAVWKTAQAGDIRALNSVQQLDVGTKTIYAAYKDLRRRTRFSADFSPTPYDVWSFRHDRAFGIPHPGSIPPALVAHAIHYFCPPGGLVVDPMAGGGVTPDVAQSMGRRCLAYDIDPSRPDILYHDILSGFPAESQGCDLIFCDPPYHTMLARCYAAASISTAPLTAWMSFLQHLAQAAYAALRPGGYLALLLATQTEKDLPAGYGYLDHGFLGYSAALQAGFAPERRVSCPMSAGHLPQHVRRARVEGRMLGQVRDLIVVRRPLDGPFERSKILPSPQ